MRRDRAIRSGALPFQSRSIEDLKAVALDERRIVGILAATGQVIFASVRKSNCPKIMMTTLEEVYFDQISDLHSAETQLLGILPKMAGDATCLELRNAFANHLTETQGHVDRLNLIMDRHDIAQLEVTCEAMRGLVIEARKHVCETQPGDVRDALLIASANRIEHYEIAGYGVAKAFASSLGFGDDADLLDETLREEGAADATITKIATGGIFRSGVNEAASHA